MSFCYFTERDVVRHRLVREIILAFDREPVSAARAAREAAGERGRFRRAGDASARSAARAAPPAPDSHPSDLALAVVVLAGHDPHPLAVVVPRVALRVGPGPADDRHRRVRLPGSEGAGRAGARAGCARGRTSPPWSCAATRASAAAYTRLEELRDKVRTLRTARGGRDVLLSRSPGDAGLRFSSETTRARFCTRRRTCSRT